MPKVSVLMPVYKTDEAFLRAAIESILNQTFTDFEFLILDDCPEDDREAVVKSYADGRIKYVKNERNLGITPSRNKLIEMAEGEYLAVFDHDDISLPTRFEKQVAYLDAHSECGVVGSWREDFLQNQVYKFPAEDIEIKKLLTDVCAVTHPASMIRKAVLDEHNLRYEEEYSPAEDYCLWLRLIEFTSFHNIQEVLFKYRLHENNTTNHQMMKMVEATKKLHCWVRNKHADLYQSYLKDRTQVIKIRLFAVIPLLKIRIKSDKMICYLFDFVPFLSFRRKVLSWPK